MSYDLLEKINSPSDLKAMDESEIPKLCNELREFLIEKVGERGGHLASNLGVCELTVAIHRIFDSPRDHVVFDVGHQSYAHKVFTGRREAFDTLRSPGGLSGFTSRKESEHDAFGAGHSSTSVSAALGIAKAEKLLGSDAYTVAVLGDGAYTGGMVHEALNNCTPDMRLIIILNENGMSISLNKGSFASYLTRVRVSKRYRGFKRGTKSVLDRIPLVGKPVARLFERIKTKIKNVYMSPNYFEDLGLYYIGPIDGNNYKKLSLALNEAKSLERCVVVHVKTQKGKGYPPAEKEPDNFHNMPTKNKSETRFHSVFAEQLVKMAETDSSVVAVTAAMGKGTGLEIFEHSFPDRCFDVGIAEEHAITFSAGLASAGLKPYVAIYSTFLQRAYDNIIHDVCLQNLPVKLIIDRATLAISDGPTHHGIFDVAFLSHIPNMTIFTPITYASLCEAMSLSQSIDTPVAIRYPNAAENSELVNLFCSVGGSSSFGVRADFDTDVSKKYLLITYGNIANKVIVAEKMLRDEGFDVGTILLEKLKPYESIAKEVKGYVEGSQKVLFIEEGIKNGGAGMLFADALADLGVKLSGKYFISAIDDNFAAPSEQCEIYDYVGLSPEKIVEKVKNI